MQPYPQPNPPMCTGSQGTHPHHGHPHGCPRATTCSPQPFTQTCPLHMQCPQAFFSTAPQYHRTANPTTDSQPQKGVVCLPDSHLCHLTDNTIAVLLVLFEGNVTS